MKTLENYLDEFKEKLKIESDYGVAKELGIARQQMSRIRNGYVAIGREKCVRIASALKIDPIEIIGTIEAAKEKKPEIKAIWIKLVKNVENQRLRSSPDN
jgi:transcriptional regulator with XRE-family HTH domain